MRKRFGKRRIVLALRIKSLVRGPQVGLGSPGTSDSWNDVGHCRHYSRILCATLSTVLGHRFSPKMRR